MGSPTVALMGPAVVDFIMSVLLLTCNAVSSDNPHFSERIRPSCHFPLQFFERQLVNFETPLSVRSNSDGIWFRHNTWGNNVVGIIDSCARKPFGARIHGIQAYPSTGGRHRVFDAAECPGGPRKILDVVNGPFMQLRITLQVEGVFPIYVVSESVDVGLFTIGMTPNEAASHGDGLPGS